MNLTDSVLDAAPGLRTAQSYLPEPATNGVGIFKDIWQTALSVGGSLLDKTISAQGSQILNGSSSDLIATQVEMQNEMQVTSMVSNIEKSRHESKMAAIRNIRVN